MASQNQTDHLARSTRPLPFRWVDINRDQIESMMQKSWSWHGRIFYDEENNDREARKIMFIQGGGVRWYQRNPTKEFFCSNFIHHHQPTQQFDSIINSHNGRKTSSRLVIQLNDIPFHRDLDYLRDEKKWGKKCSRIEALWTKVKVEINYQQSFCFWSYIFPSSQILFNIVCNYETWHSRDKQCQNSKS